MARGRDAKGRFLRSGGGSRGRAGKKAARRARAAVVRSPATVAGALGVAAMTLGDASALVGHPRAGAVKAYLAGGPRAALNEAGMLLAASDEQGIGRGAPILVVETWAPLIGGLVIDAVVATLRSRRPSIAGFARSLLRRLDAAASGRVTG